MEPGPCKQLQWVDLAILSKVEFDGIFASMAAASPCAIGEHNPQQPG